MYQVLFLTVLDRIVLLATTVLSSVQCSFLCGRSATLFVRHCPVCVRDEKVRVVTNSVMTHHHDNKTT